MGVDTPRTDGAVMIVEGAGRLVRVDADRACRVKTKGWL